MNNGEKNKSPDIALAKQSLALYKREKAELERRIEYEDAIWHRVYSSNSSSAWIFNSMVNKHADIIDNMPSCSCLPREERDEDYADKLSKIIPVIFDRIGFKQIYSDNAWDKLKHGTSVYGVFWNTALEDGLGDIDIKALNISDIFWDMGVGDIQDSKNLFIVSYADISALEARYGNFKYSENREADIEMSAILGASNDFDGKCAVIDWYYKTYGYGGKSTLHLCKFCGDTVLYSSESDANCVGGWYGHGMYPIVFDRMYPCNDGACGFGIISIASDAQDSINRLDENMLSYSDWSSRVRFWAKSSLGINEKEFLDLDRSIVEVEGDINEEKLRQIEISPMDDLVVECKRMKIDEIKEITGSRDVSQGGVTNGVTAASAISILREAGAKSSRDGIEESNRAFVKMVEFIIELIGQFYTSDRIFRIVGEDGKASYLRFSGKKLREDTDGYRPHFDIEINAAKKSPSEASEKNAFAKELYDSGAFKRENIKETLFMLELMDFDGVGKLKASLRREYGDGGDEADDKR